jgi:hypothetical protein
MQGKISKVIEKIRNIKAHIRKRVERKCEIIINYEHFSNAKKM